MLEIKLLALFAVCLSVILTVGAISVKFCRGRTKTAVPLIIVPLTADMETPEFIVRNCVYRIAGEYPETTALAVDLGAGEETLRIFGKLMERSCSYRIIEAGDCPENVCEILKDTVGY